MIKTQALGRLQKKGKMITELVKFKNKTGLYLDGLYFSVPEADTVIVHVHGSFGNFYSNSFIKTMAESYTNNKINFLSFNLTQHDGVAEAVRAQHGVECWEYIGYSLSKYEECLYDISGAIAFVQSQGNNRIVLQGHSLGCNRILYYLSETHSKYDIILLSPTNSKKIQELWIAPESIEHQINRLKEDKDNHFINCREHGVHSANGVINDSIDNSPFIPISNLALLSLLENPSLDLINYVYLNDYHKINLFSYLGGADEYQTDSIQDYINVFNRSFSSFHYLYIDNGTHSFLHYENSVISEIIKWINKS